MYKNLISNNFFKVTGRDQIDQEAEVLVEHYRRPIIDAIENVPTGKNPFDRIESLVALLAEQLAVAHARNHALRDVLLGLDHRHLQEVADEILGVPFQPVLRSRVFLSLEAGIPGDGFSFTEYDSRGVPYRWMVGEKGAHLSFSVAYRRQLKFSINTFSYAEGLGPDDIDIQVNCGDGSLELEKSPFEIKGVYTPKNDMHSSMVLLQIVPKRTVVAAPGQDKRKISVAVISIALEDKDAADQKQAAAAKPAAPADSGSSDGSPIDDSHDGTDHGEVPAGVEPADRKPDEDRKPARKKAEFAV